MITTSSKTEIDRQSAIAQIRSALLQLTDDEHSACQIAAQKGIFCGGFRRYTDEEIRTRYDWLVRKNPSMPREDLEELANRWQLARQIVNNVGCACDAQTMEEDTCRGWTDFSNEELSRFCREILNIDVAVT